MAIIKNILDKIKSDIQDAELVEDTSAPEVTSAPVAETNTVATPVDTKPHMEAIVTPNHIYPIPSNVIYPKDPIVTGEWVITAVPASLTTEEE